MMLEQVLKMFVMMFVVIEPITLVPAFGALTSGADDAFRRRMAVKSTVVSAVIFTFFALVGEKLLHVLGISVDAFKIGGGLLLFMVSVDMVFARESGIRSTTVIEQDEARHREDISVFPLAFPLIAGPGALATLLLLLGETAQDPLMITMLVLVAMVVLAITLAMMLLTTPVMKIMGVTGANVVSRLLGVILVAMAVQFVVDGVKAQFF